MVDGSAAHNGDEELNVILAVFDPETAHAAQVRVDAEGQTLWATTAMIARMFDCTPANVLAHVTNIYEEGVLDREATTKKFLVVADEGGRRGVRRQLDHYNLDVMLATGFRVSSARAIQFQRWALATLREYALNGWVVDENRLANDPEALKRLSGAIRRVRLSERAAYAKVREVFKIAASDYDSGSQAARSFYAMAQDKFHFAVTGKTAAEIVLERADARRANIGLATMAGDQPTIADAKVGKNYLNADELALLENICEQWMLFCETKSMRGQKMTMEELLFRINTLLTANDYPILFEYKEYKRGQADAHAQKQLDRYTQLGGPDGRKRLKG
jgi:hypothetical protein